jgi:hypothetical protein
MSGTVKRGWDDLTAPVYRRAGNWRDEASSIKRDISLAAGASRILRDVLSRFRSNIHRGDQTVSAFAANPGEPQLAQVPRSDGNHAGFATWWKSSKKIIQREQFGTGSFTWIVG